MGFGVCLISVFGILVPFNVEIAVVLVCSS